MKVVNLIVLFELLAPVYGAMEIKHIVAVMLENRAFDHVFGWAGQYLGVNGLL